MRSFEMDIGTNLWQRTSFIRYRVTAFSTFTALESLVVPSHSSLLIMFAS